MKKQALLMVVFLAAVGLLAGVAASTAGANAGGLAGLPCGMTGCHGSEGTVPVVTLDSITGSNATYSFAATDALQWAVFNGSTQVGEVQSGSTGTFTVAVGSTYTIYSIYGKTADIGTKSGASTTVSPEGGAASFTITSTAGENGAISPATPQTVASGDDITFTITPDTGYQIVDVLVNGGSVGAVSTYTFSDVTADGTISATFAPEEAVTYSIVPTAGANGAISPAVAQVVEEGSDATFAITPDSGYYVDTLTVDGTAVEPAKSYTFTDVSADHTIAATFAATPMLCTITSSIEGTGGTIVPGSPVWNMAPGSSITYEFVPDPAFHVDTVLVDGWPVAVDEDNLYTFSAVDRNHTVSVKFAANEWTISASSGANGSVTPAGDTKLLEGASATYTIAAAPGYHINGVLVDKVSVGIPTSYTFADVTEDHTISATFAADVVNYTITPSVAGGSGGVIVPAFPFTVAREEASRSRSCRTPATRSAP